MKKVFVLLALLMVLFSVREAAAVVIMPSVRGFVIDNTGDDGVGDFSFSTASDLTHYVGVDARPIFEYDVSGITDPVTSAIIELNIIPGRRGPFPFDVDFYSYPGNGALDLSDFSEGGMKFATVSYNNTDLITVDVTSQVQFLTGGGGDFLGINVRLPAEGISPLSPFFRFHDTSSSTTQNLTVLTQSQGGGPSGSTAVPEPSTVILTGLGLAAAGFRRRFFG